MGIPRLLHLLEPYATPIVFNSKSEYGPKAVVDGPGLAYHAYYRALTLRHAARNALEAIPSYADVVQVALLWLQTLQSNGLEMWVSVAVRGKDLLKIMPG